MDIGRNLPSTEEILRAFGHSRRGSNDVLAELALFGAGVLVGAGLALLFAPTSGQQLREEIGERVGDVRQRIAGGGSETMENGGERKGRI